MEITLNKFLNKWFRKFHRWLVLPFITLLLTVIFMRGTAFGDVAQRIQAIFMIIMALKNYLKRHSEPICETRA